MDRVSVVLGRDLASEDLRLINLHRKKEFNSPNPVVPSPENDDWQKPYFLLRHNGALAAFARLHVVEVVFRGVRYEIFGVATVIAIVKAKGFGREVMGAIKVYVEASGKTAVGFCDPSISAFYEKCGYTTVRRGMDRFIFINNGKKVEPSHPEGDVFYLSGRDNLMQEVQKDPKELITAFKYAW